MIPKNQNGNNQAKDDTFVQNHLRKKDSIKIPIPQNFSSYFYSRFSNVYSRLSKCAFLFSKFTLWLFNIFMLAFVQTYTLAFFTCIPSPFQMYTIVFFSNLYAGSFSKKFTFSHYFHMLTVDSPNIFFSSKCVLFLCPERILSHL